MEVGLCESMVGGGCTKRSVGLRCAHFESIDHIDEVLGDLCSTLGELHRIVWIVEKRLALSRDWRHQHQSQHKHVLQHGRGFACVPIEFAGQVRPILNCRAVRRHNRWLRRIFFELVTWYFFITTNMTLQAEPRIGCTKTLSTAKACVEHSTNQRP